MNDAAKIDEQRVAELMAAHGVPEQKAWYLLAIERGDSVNDRIDGDVCSEGSHATVELIDEIIAAGVPAPRNYGDVIIGRPKHRRAGCLLCKPSKLNAHKTAERMRADREWRRYEAAAR